MSVKNEFRQQGYRVTDSYELLVKDSCFLPPEKI